MTRAILCLCFAAHVAAPVPRLPILSEEFLVGQWDSEYGGHRGVSEFHADGTLVSVYVTGTDGQFVRTAIYREHWRLDRRNPRRVEIGYAPNQGMFRTLCEMELDDANGLRLTTCGKPTNPLTLTRPRK